VNDKNRWYDNYPDLKVLLKKLKDLEKQKRDRLILNIKDIIIDHDEQLFDKYVFEFPMPWKRRWYDKSPFLYLVINALKYADEDLITDIILYLKEKL
jgi:hypothetical protein